MNKFKVGDSVKVVSYGTPEDYSAGAVLPDILNMINNGSYIVEDIKNNLFIQIAGNQLIRVNGFLFTENELEFA